MANNWTREETIVAFNLYCKIPFNESSQHHPLIIKYAKLLGRTPSALNMKIGNLGRLDPQLQARGISGLTHGAKMEEQIWAEFSANWDSLAAESESIIAKLKERAGTATEPITSAREGKDVRYLTKARVNQNYFRTSVLVNYRYCCCITGVTNENLLIASHIVPWAHDHTNRTKPSNGLCLNTLHDKAFDIGLITITTDFRVRISEELYYSAKENEFLRRAFLIYKDKKIFLPDKFWPEKEFLEYHNNNIFKDRI